jgi:carbonic anhydrase
MPKMDPTDEAITANEEYARSFTLSDLPHLPARKLVVVACMDGRLALEQMLGLKVGDAHMIRNAGGIVTDDVLRSVIISHHLLGTEEIIIINHTDCGMLRFRDEELHSTLEQKTGATPEERVRFHAFDDLESNVHQQVQRVKSHPWIPPTISVRGFIYDVKTGRLREVSG